jgi:hypothetical protein
LGGMTPWGGGNGPGRLCLLDERDFRAGALEIAFIVFEWPLQSHVRNDRGVPDRNPWSFSLMQGGVDPGREGLEPAPAPPGDRGRGPVQDPHVSTGGRGAID